MAFKKERGLSFFAVTLSAFTFLAAAMLGNSQSVMAEGEPIANAGVDQVADELTTVTLDGSGSSSPSGVPIATYQWIQVDSRCTSAGTGIEYYCPFVTLDGNGTAVATFQVPDLPPSAYYIFNLIATDENGLASAPDDVKISVNDLSNTSGQVPSTTTSPEPTTPSEEQPLAGESGNQSPSGQNATQGAAVTEIPDGSITASKLAPNSVTTDCQGVTPQLESLSKGPIADKASPQKGRISKQSALTGQGFDPIGNMAKYMTVASTNNPVESVPGTQQQGQVSFKSPCVSKLADHAVINSKIADNAVDSKKIKDGTVKSTDIGDGEVRSSDIGNGQVKLSKLGTDVPTLPKVTINQETVEIPVLFLGFKTFTVGCPDNTVTTGGGFLLDDDWWLGVRESAPHVGVGGTVEWSVTVYPLATVIKDFAGKLRPTGDQFKNLNAPLTIYAVCLQIVPHPPIIELPVPK